MEIALQDFLTTVEGAITMYAPSIVSIISMVATIFVAIMKFKQSARDSYEELKKTTLEVGKSNNNVKDVNDRVNVIIAQNTEMRDNLMNEVAELNASISTIKADLRALKKEGKDV